MAIVASPEAMDQTATNIENNVEELAGLMQSISNHVGNNGENWKDEQGKTYNEKYEELKSEMPAYVDKGHAAAAFMKGVSNAYRETVRINQAAVRTDQVQ